MRKDDMDIACVFSWQLIDSQLEWLYKANNLDYLAATAAFSHKGLTNRQIATLHKEMLAHSTPQPDISNDEDLVEKEKDS